MADPPLNPSQHVERIREILVGRQMHQVEDRLRTLEGAVQRPPAPEIAPEFLQRMQAAQGTVLEEAQQLRHELQRESELRNRQYAQLCRQLEEAGRQFQAVSAQLSERENTLERNLSSHLETISSAMAARIDARVREILQHLQTELSQWKGEVDRNLQTLRDESVSRNELKRRFARLASAAMEDDPKAQDGFLL